MRPVNPTFPARFVVSESYKPTSDFEQDEYSMPRSLNMKANFVFMDVAPALRLQLVWKDGDFTNRNPLKGCIDLPFTGDLALRDFKLVHGPRSTADVYELTFECNGGMVMEGHAKLLAVSKELWKSEDRDLYDYAMSLTAPDAKRVKMEL